jgi:hypothetical protein
MNGYIAFSHTGKRAEIYAETLYEAKQKALDMFKPPKSKVGMVSVTLAETNVPMGADGKPLGEGTQVVHRAVD